MEVLWVRTPRSHLPPTSPLLPCSPNSRPLAQPRQGSLKADGEPWYLRYLPYFTLGLPKLLRYLTLQRPCSNWALLLMLRTVTGPAATANLTGPQLPDTRYLPTYVPQVPEQVPCLKVGCSCVSRLCAALLGAWAKNLPLNFSPSAPVQLRLPLHKHSTSIHHPHLVFLPPTSTTTQTSLVSSRQPRSRRRRLSHLAAPFSFPTSFFFLPLHRQELRN